jgi:tripartite-type tricarboxylate transporter receptor subunit TctC
LVVPKTTPAAVVQKLNTALNAAVNSKEIHDVLVRQGVDPTSSTPAKARQWVEAEFDRWGRVATAAHISAN